MTYIIVLHSLGDNVNATSLGTFCGTSTPNYVTTDSNMTVTFISDYSVTKTGFSARYKSGPRGRTCKPLCY